MQREVTAPAPHLAVDLVAIKASNKTLHRYSLDHLREALITIKKSAAWRTLPQNVQETFSDADGHTLRPTLQKALEEMLERKGDVPASQRLDGSLVWDLEKVRALSADLAEVRDKDLRDALNKVKLAHSTGGRTLLEVIKDLMQEQRSEEPSP